MCELLHRFNEMLSFNQIVKGNESGYFTMTWNARDHGANEMNYSKA